MDVSWCSGVTHAVSISQSTPTRTASGTFFELSYSPRGRSSSRTRSTITSMDDSRSHRFYSMYECLSSCQKSPASQKTPAGRSSQATSTVCHSTAKVMLRSCRVENGVSRLSHVSITLSGRVQRILHLVERDLSHEVREVLEKEFKREAATNLSMTELGIDWVLL